MRKTAMFESSMQPAQKAVIIIIPCSRAVNASKIGSVPYIWGTLTIQF